VRLDEFDRLRRHAGLAVRGQEAPPLPLGARRVDRVPLPVATRPDALDDGVDQVTVSLRVRQALQHDHAQTFAEDGAVAVGVERLRVPRRRERRGLAEAHVHEDVVERVAPAGDDHVGAAGLQFECREVDRAQRTGTRGVDDAVRAAEVEAVGDAAGDDVAEQAREAVLLPRDVALGDAPRGVLDLLVRDAGRLHRPLPLRVAEPRAERDDEFQRAGDAEDDRDAGAVD
jgi:hypothetical protein